MRLKISWILFLHKTTARKYSGPVALVHLGLKRTGHEWTAMVLRLDRRSCKTKETGLNTTPPSPTHTPIKRIPMCIAGLHVTSRRPCWRSRTKGFLSSGNWIYFHVNSLRKNSVLLTPNMGALSHGCIPRIIRRSISSGLYDIHVRICVAYLRILSENYK